MTNKTFNSNYSSTLIVILACLFFIALGLYENNFQNLPATAYLLAVLVITVTVYFDSNTWLRLSNGTLHASGTTWSKNTLELSDITEIRRVRVSWLFKQGANMHFYKGNERILFAHEANYSNETLRNFLAEIVERGPHIKLDQQYQDLISGKLEKDGVNFRELMADRQIDD